VTDIAGGASQVQGGQHEGLVHGGAAPIHQAPDGVQA
jgi:hypothetical protein